MDSIGFVRPSGGQSHAMSLTESAVNTVGGLFIALGIQVTIFPWFGIHVPLSTNLWIGAIMFAQSIIRQYIIRRIFNSFR